MRFYKKSTGLLLFVFLLSLLFTHCRKEDDVIPEETPLAIIARNEFFLLMNEWYLWYEKMPVVNVEDYNSPEQLLEAIRYDSLDKWSYISPLDDFLSYYQEGEYEGHGFGYTYDQDGKAWITFVFEDGDFYEQGVKRGWQIIKINGSDIQPFTDLSFYMNGLSLGTVDHFSFMKPGNASAEVSSIRKVVKINTVLYSDTIHVGGKVVGHLVFKSFIEPSIAELDTAFLFFQSAGIQELILDLRYNGGGRMDVTMKLASLISGPATDGKTLVKYMHNNKQTSQNSIVYLENEAQALNLNRLIVITSQGTASASEVIINGLKPYINVITIGDNTYGKPVGMYSWSYADTYAFVPVCFKMSNVNNVGDYYDGLQADSYIEDGLEWEFSDRNELRLKEAIYYLETGNFTGSPAPLKSARLIPVIQKQGLKFEIGAE